MARPVGRGSKEPCGLFRWGRRGCRPPPRPESPQGSLESLAYGRDTRGPLPKGFPSALPFLYLSTPAALTMGLADLKGDCWVEGLGAPQPRCGLAPRALRKVRPGSRVMANSSAVGQLAARSGAS